MEIKYIGNITLVQHIDQRSIVVNQEALHNKDETFLLLLTVRLWDSLTNQGIMRLLKPHWVLPPCIDHTHHGVHVQSSNDIPMLTAIFTNFNLIFVLEEVKSWESSWSILDGFPSVGYNEYADTVLNVFGWSKLGKKKVAEFHMSINRFRITLIRQDEATTWILHGTKVK